MIFRNSPVFSNLEKNEREQKYTFFFRDDIKETADQTQDDILCNMSLLRNASHEKKIEI